MGTNSSVTFSEEEGLGGAVVDLGGAEEGGEVGIRAGKGAERGYFGLKAVVTVREEGDVTVGFGLGFGGEGGR